MIRMIVDLPAPFGPIKPMTVPSSTLKSICFNWKCLYFLEMPLTSIAHFIIFPPGLA